MDLGGKNKFEYIKRDHILQNSARPYEEGKNSPFSVEARSCCLCKKEIYGVDYKSEHSVELITCT